MVKSGKDWLPDCREFHDHDMFHILRFSDGNKRIDHDCAFTQHPLAKVQITTTLYIYEPDQSLNVMTSYVIHASKESSSQILAHLKTLTHKDIGNWLTKLFDEAGSAFAGWHKNSYFLISAVHPERPNDHNEPISPEIVITRNLGDGKSPNKQWNANIHF